LPQTTEEPIEFLRKLRDLEVTEMETALFKCEVTKADVKAKWSCNGKALTEKDGFDIKVEKTVHTLTLDDVALEDAGTYCVKVEDKESSGKLVVRGNSSPQYLFTYISAQLSTYSHILVRNPSRYGSC
jgi:hypothetical protein